MGGVLFGLFQLAAPRDLARWVRSGLPRWLSFCSRPWPWAIWSLMLSPLWALNIRIEVRPLEVRSGSGGI